MRLQHFVKPRKFKRYRHWWHDVKLDDLFVRYWVTMPDYIEVYMVRRGMFCDEDEINSVIKSYVASEFMWGAFTAAEVCELAVKTGRRNETYVHELCKMGYRFFLWGDFEILDREDIPYGTRT